jgi:hypothetical protein
MSVWESFVETATQDDYALVLESDAEITRYGKKYLSQVLESFSKSDRNVLHLGSHETIKKYLSPKLTISTSNSDIILDFASSSLLKLLSPIFRRNFFYFSTHAYLISYRFASFLVRGAPPPLMPIDVYLQSLSQSRNNLIDSTLQALFRQSKGTPSLVNQLGR